MPKDQLEPGRMPISTRSSWRSNWPKTTATPHRPLGQGRAIQRERLSLAALLKRRDIVDHQVALSHKPAAKPTRECMIGHQLRAFCVILHLWSPVGSQRLATQSDQDDRHAPKALTGPMIVANTGNRHTDNAVPHRALGACLDPQTTQ